MIVKDRAEQTEDNWKNEGVREKSKAHALTLRQRGDARKTNPLPEPPHSRA